MVMLCSIGTVVGVSSIGGSWHVLHRLSLLDLPWAIGPIIEAPLVLWLASRLHDRPVPRC